VTKGQQGQGNCAYVRKLLQQKQPEFSAVLEFAVREVSIQLGAGPAISRACSAPGLLRWGMAGGAPLSRL
jgi:hypothetical protein